MGLILGLLHPVFNRGSLSDAEVRASWAERQRNINNKRNNGDKGSNHVGL